METILKSFEKFAGALRPFAIGYFKKQTSEKLKIIVDFHTYQTLTKFLSFFDKAILIVNFQ